MGLLPNVLPIKYSILYSKKNLLNSRLFWGNESSSSSSVVEVGPKLQPRKRKKTWKYHTHVYSSIGPGPLQDVIVPQVLTKEIHKESMTPDLTDLTNIYKNVTDAKDWPPVDIFASVMDDEAKSPKKGF